MAPHPILPFLKEEWQAELPQKMRRLELQGLPQVSDKLVCRGGTSGAMEKTRSCTVAAGGADYGTRGKAIRDPAEALGEGRDKTGGVHPGIETSNIACYRSIRGSDILDISSKIPDRSNKVERSRGGTDIFGISYSPRSIDAMQGQGRVSRSTVIYTMSSMR